MGEEISVGCARPTGGPVGKEINNIKKTEEANKKEEFMVMVGKPAPDFIAPAYYKGKFIEVKLSDYLGKWVLLCFYPGDFTFV